MPPMQQHGHDLSFSNANTENQFVAVLFSCRMLEAPSVMLQ
jgi:hypothetical protein